MAGARLGLSAWPARSAGWTPSRSELETLVRSHPLRERLRAQLMLALYRSGRQADALEVYREGRELLQQVDTPQELYARPANLFVAAFIGSPAMNLVEAEIAGGELHFAGYAIPLPAAIGAPAAGRVIAGIRPEAFEDAAFAEPSLPRVDVKVEVVEELGADTHVLFSVAAPRVEASEVREAAGDEDATVSAVEGSLFTARVDPGTAARPGKQLRLAVDPARFHYFDPESGLRLQPEREPVAVGA